MSGEKSPTSVRQTESIYAKASITARRYVHTWKKTTYSIHNEKAPIFHRLNVFPIADGRLPPFRPVMNLLEVPARMPGLGVQDDLVAHAMPFHGREVGMALDGLAEVVDTVFYVCGSLLAGGDCKVMK